MQFDEKVNDEIDIKDSNLHDYTRHASLNLLCGKYCDMMFHTFIGICIASKLMETAPSIDPFSDFEISTACICFVSLCFKVFGSIHTLCSFVHIAAGRAPVATPNCHRNRALLIYTQSNYKAFYSARQFYGFMLFLCHHPDSVIILLLNQCVGSWYRVRIASVV